MRRHGENHAHVERDALVFVAFNNRGKCRCTDRVLGAAIVHQGDVRLHLFPDVIGHGDRVAVQVHREGCDDMCLGAVSDGRGKRLPRKHMRAVKLPVDDTVQQNFPVCLCFERYKKALVFEVAIFVGDRQGGHIREFNKPKSQFVFF